MRCPFCQAEIGEADTACPRCRRPHAPQVGRCLQQAWGALQQGQQASARAAFDEALKATPPGDQPQVGAYIAYLARVAQTPAALQPPSPGPTPTALQPPSPGQPQAAAAPVAQPVPSAGTLSTWFRFPWFLLLVVCGMLFLCVLPSSGQRAAVIVPIFVLIWVAALVAIFVHLRRTSGRPQVGSPRALFLHFNERPANIVQVMDEARRREAEFARARRQRMVVIALLVPAGLVFILADLALGYNLFTFSLVALALWGAALVGFVVLRRDRPAGREFGPRYEATRTVFATIRDDVAPKRTLLGWLDLTGPQPGKVIREGTSASGAPIKVYRDEWLRMKLVLYDGNVLRVLALERIKARLGRWKRGISGKRKWREGKTFSRHELRVSLTVNPQAYTIEAQPVAEAGKLLVAVTRQDGRLLLTAESDAAFAGEDVLRALRLAYGQLRPRAPLATAGG